MSNKVQKPNCLKCAFYYVTWDSKARHGCRQFGFKTPKLPSQVVSENSCEGDCQAYKEKRQTRQNTGNQ